MNDQHPITPPPELVQQWCLHSNKHETADQFWRHIATQAARWGADQELEACCKWLPKLPPWSANDLRKHRRPTPQPVAVSERLPGPEDCDEQGRCWLLTVEDEYPQWRLHSIEGAQPGGAMIWVPVDSSPGVMVDCFYTSHWLPANALPNPEATND